MCIEDDYPCDDDYSPITIAPLCLDDSNDIYNHIDLELIRFEATGLLLHGHEVNMTHENKNKTEENDFTIMPLSVGMMTNSFPHVQYDESTVPFHRAGPL